MPEASNTLDYAHAKRWHGSRRLRRWIISLAIVLAVAVTSFRWGGPLWQHVQYLRMQSAWLNAIEPPDTIVYEEDPAESVKLLATGKYIRVPYDGTFAGKDWNPVARMQQFSHGIFLHGRTNQRGERLLMVYCSTVNQEELGHGRIVRLTASVESKAGIRPGSRAMDVGSNSVDLIQSLSEGDYVRFYAGQPDPSDLSRFTIRYTLNGVEGTIDGKLNDDDTVTLTDTSRGRGG